VLLKGRQRDGGGGGGVVTTVTTVIVSVLATYRSGSPRSRLNGLGRGVAAVITEHWHLCRVFVAQGSRERRGAIRFIEIG
jgi:hypothetical protein